MQRYDELKYAQALEDYRAALEYPDNLEVGKPDYDEKVLRTYYLMATAYQALGETDKAAEYFHKTIAQKADNPQIRYFQAWAHWKLGRKDAAAEIYEDLIETGNERLQAQASEDFFAKFGRKQSRQNPFADAHYIIALGRLGKGEQQKAKTRLKEALKLNINHTWAAVMLSKIK